MENLRQRIFYRNRKTAFFWEGGKQGHLLVNLKISLVLLPTLIPWNYLSFVQRNLYHLWKPLRRNSVWECKNRHESGLAAILRVSPCWEPQASLASFCNGNRYLKLCNVNVTTEKWQKVKEIVVIIIIATIWGGYHPCCIIWKLNLRNLIK